MQDALGVRSPERIDEPERHVHDGHDVHRSRAQTLLERFALEQLHRDERRVGADVVDGADIRMVQRCGRAGLTLEPFDRLGIGLESLGQRLERDDPPESCVLSAIDLAHATRSDHGLDGVRPEPAPRLECHLIQ